MFGVPDEDVTEEQRGLAKVVTFSIIFGASAYGIAKKLGKTAHEGERLRGLYFDAHPRVHAFLKATVQRVLDTGEARTLAGRVRRFGNLHAMGRKEAGAAVREAMNMPMQGSCADGLKLALALLYERRRKCPGAFPIVALHDEIVVECDEGDTEKVAAWLEAAMKDGMAEVLALGTGGDAEVPVEVEIKSGSTWADDTPSLPQAPEHPEEEGFTVCPLAPNEHAHVRTYIDYRHPAAEVYPQIDACDGCAESLGESLGEQDAPRPGEAARCEICGIGNAASLGL